MLFHFPRALREKYRKIERMKEMRKERSIEKIKKINKLIAQEHILVWQCFYDVAVIESIFN